MLMRHTAPTVLALLLMAVPALAQNPRDSAVAAVDRAFENYRGTSVPGCAVAVSRDGNVVLERAYGMANLETSTPIQPGTIFHVASVSKQFTAMAILLLAKDGRLSLDDDIRKHLPEIPDYGPTITIRHLLNHTSGLRDQWDLLALARGRFEENRITEADVLDIVPRQKALNFMPGAEYMYSNTGYTLAAVIVKRVSGRSLRAFAHERIFAPLGMNDTHFHDDFTMVVPGRAWAYVPAFGAATNFRTSVPNYDTYGATSLFTTVGDLLKWERNFTTMKVGDAALFTEMHRNGRLNGGDSTGYALGVGVGAYRGARIVEHTGGDAGYRSYLGRFPDQKLAIALACNTSTANVSALPRRIADIYIGDLLATQSPPVTPQGVALTAEQLRGRAGAYFQPTLVQFAEITFRDGKLFLGRTGSNELIPVTGDRFRTGTGQVEYVFKPEGYDAVSLSTGRVWSFERKAPMPISPAAMQPFAGEYYSEELNATYRVAANDTSITIQTGTNDPIPARSLFTDTFSARNYTLQFARSGRQVTGFEITTGRVRRVKFARVR
jgi:CubicO group peptidase (beta-lactamase class C family)